MTREEKDQSIAVLKEEFEQASNFYLTDSSTLTVEQTNKFRRMCFERGITFKVAKNTLIRKALDQVENRNYSELFDHLHGPTAIMFSEVSNDPAKVLKDFRKKFEKPVLKAAYIDTDVFVGDEMIEELAKLKSKEELIGEVISLLQSPAKNVISALQSGGGKLAGILKTLSEREEA